MSLKRKVATLEEVDEKFRPLYKEVEEAGVKRFVLDLEVDKDDDVTPLKNALENAKAERAAAKAERDAAVALAKQKGEDITALEASYKGKLESASQHETTALKSLQSALTNATFGQTAAQLALKLGGEKGSVLLKPHIEKRLKVELDGENAIVRVLDKAGKMSASSLTDLEKEFREDPIFATAIVGSRGSGVGGPPAKIQGGALDTGETSNFNPNKATPGALAAWVAQRTQNKE